MRPDLSIPAAKPGSFYQYPVEPKVVKRLIDSLPADIDQRLRRLRDGAKGLAYVDLRSSRRLALLALYRNAVEGLQPKLQRFLVGLSLPLNERAQRVSCDCGELYAVLANGYKRVILEYADSEGQRRRDSKDLTRASYWAIALLGEQLKVCYESYRQVPAGLWREIHALYDYARDCGVEQVPLRIDDTGTTRNLHHLYRRVLLLGLSDPYQLPFRAVPAIYQALDNWAYRARLGTRSERTSRRCLFVVTPDLDRPALPALPHARIGTGVHQLIFDTTQLVSHLRHKMDDVISETLSDLDNEQTRFTRFEKVETLRNLIVKWGLHPVRGAQRVRTYKECDLVIGLNSICQILNDNKPVQFKRKLDDVIVSANMLRGTFGLKQQQSAATPRLSHNWELADESTEGIRLLLNNEDHTQVRVGELVAFRARNGHDDWTVGVVRWAQADDNDKLTIGLYKLGTGALPVAVRPMATVDKTASVPYKLALFLDQHQDNGRRFSLVTDRGLYRPKVNLWLHSPSYERIVECANVIMSTRCFIWFDALPAHARPEETLELIYPRQFA